MQLLHLVNRTDYKLKYYRNENLLTKKFLIDIILGNPLYSKYIHNSANLDKFSKAFLSTVSINLIFQLIASPSPQTYGKLYEIYKNQELKKACKKWGNYEV